MYRILYIAALQQRLRFGLIFKFRKGPHILYGV